MFTLQFANADHACKNLSRQKNYRKLKLFSRAGPLELVTMDILGPLLRTSEEKKLGVVIVDIYSKLTKSKRATQTAKTKATQIETRFSWPLVRAVWNPVVSAYWKRTAVRRKCFYYTTLCSSPVSKNWRQLYIPQINERVESYSWKIMARLSHYVVEHQRD